MKEIIREFVIEIVSFFILSFSMALLWEYNIILLFIYLIVFLVYALIWKRKVDIVLFVVASIFFQTGEIIISYFGAWEYTNPSYLGIPIWITLSWGFAAIIIFNFGKTITKFLFTVKIK